jgi:predicted nucleic acid-binding protein
VRAFVVDASVAVKWHLPSGRESLVPQARHLLESYVQGTIRLLAPDLFWVEVGNFTWKAVRARRVSTAQAVVGLNLLRELRILTFPCVDLLPEAMSIALAHQRTVYDSLYVALAVQSKCELITADERLANALAARLPVKWLGAR